MSKKGLKMREEELKKLLDVLPGSPRGAKLSRYTFGTVRHNESGVHHLWNLRTRNTIATIKFGESVVISYRENSWYAPFLSTYTFPGHDKGVHIHLIGENLRRRNRWTRGELEGLCRVTYERWKKNEEPEKIKPEPARLSSRLRDARGRFVSANGPTRARGDLSFREQYAVFLNEDDASRIGSLVNHYVVGSTSLGAVNNRIRGIETQAFLRTQRQHSWSSLNNLRRTI